MKKSSFMQAVVIQLSDYVKKTCGTYCKYKPRLLFILIMSPKRAAGIVIFRNMNQVVQFLMLQTSYGEHHWTPPKGHVDPGESDWVTALRETKEEAGLSEDDLEIYKDVSKVLNYKVKDKPKVVVYWLAKLRNPDTRVLLSDEHQDLKWLPLKEAQEISGYDDMKQLLLEFNEKATVLSC